MLILLPPSEKKAAEAGPAISVYTGILYQGLDWSSLTQSAQKRGQQSIAIISAKYGLVHPLDEIKPYKEKIDSKKMRTPITLALNAIETELIIDCRSSTYKAVWAPPPEKSVEIKVFIQSDGVKKVITHMSKKTRGEVTRLLLLCDTSPTNPHELLTIVSRAFECQLIENFEGNPWVLEVIAQ